MYQMPTIQKIYVQIIDTTMTLDTKQLRYFYEIAQQGSVTRASQVLNVAQPALSLHLRRLEERLGTSLMLRTRTGVVPTEAGRLLMERARHYVDNRLGFGVWDLGFGVARGRHPTALLDSAE